MTDATEKSAFSTLTKELKDAVDPYTKSKLPGIPGSERAFQAFLSLLRSWIVVERWFCDGRTYADTVDGLRKNFKNDPSQVLAICRSHSQFAQTSDIVLRIISIVGEGARVDLQSSTASAMGQRVSAVAGAESLPTALPAISEIGSMGATDDYSEVALSARKLLMQESMPSIEQRKQKVINAAKTLSVAGESHTSRQADAFLADHIPMVDVFFSLLKKAASSGEEIGLLELYQRHLYRMYTVKKLERNHEQRLVKFSFLNKPSESAVNSATRVTSISDLRRIVSSGSLSTGMASESSQNSGSENNTLAHQDKEKIPETTLRTGVKAIVEKLSDLDNVAKFESILSQFPQFTGMAAAHEGAPVNVLYLIILDGAEAGHSGHYDEMASTCQTLLTPYVNLFKKADIRRVSFVFPREMEEDFEDVAPVLFTFRFPKFHEDSLYRMIDPSRSMHLDLDRVAGNFRVRSLGSRHTSTCHVHLYEGTPKTKALEKDKKANKAPRVFARALSFVLEFSAASYEHILVDALNALDLCAHKSKIDNHLFLNLVSDLEGTVLDPVVVEEVVVAVLKRHSERVSGLGISEVETRIVCCLSKGSPPIAIRLFASNPTGYVHVMNTYVEAADESSGERIFKLIGGTKASLASAGDSSWDCLNVNTPYPLTRPFDPQRKAALTASDTLYCYDLPALFEAAVERQWLEGSKKDSGKGAYGGAARPLMVMYTTELVVQKQGGSPSDHWTMQDYLNGDLELVQMNRGAGANDVGMVAWLVVLKTIEYPNVSIFNSFSYQDAVICSPKFVSF